MKTIIYFILILTFFIGCSSKNIIYKEDTVTQSRASKLYENRLRLAHINVYQNVYQLDNNDIVTHEEAYVDSGYSFAKSVNVLIGRIFNTNNYQDIERFANIYFYMLRLNSGNIYVIVQNTNKKKLDILYGNKKDLFEKFIKDIKVQQPVKLQGSLNDFKEQNVNAVQYIKSDWNYKNIIFSELIKKQGGRLRWH